MGYLRVPLNMAERIWAALSAALLVAALPWTDEVGFALGAACIGLNLWRGHRARAAA